MAGVHRAVSAIHRGGKQGRVRSFREVRDPGLELVQLAPGFAEPALERLPVRVQAHCCRHQLLDAVPRQQPRLHLRGIVQCRSRPELPGERQRRTLRLAQFAGGADAVLLRFPNLALSIEQHADRFVGSEHVSTHVDAVWHFNPDRPDLTIDRLPWEHLITPAAWINVSDVAPAAAKAAGPAYVVLAGISVSHFLNDTMQSLIASVYPILKDTYALDFAQIGMITLAFQFTASLLQPVVGHYTDKKAQPYSLSIGMASTFFGLLLLSAAHQYLVILVAAALVGLGSAVFHPE